MTPADGSGSEPTEQAARWQVALVEQPELATSTAFHEWLGHPDHRSAWASLQASVAPLEEFAQAPELALLRRHALARSLKAGRMRRGGQALMAIAAAALVGWGTVAYTARQWTYTTGAGERRPITLADKSQIWLDSNSVVDVRISGLKRDIFLRRGQGYFQVAHERWRPFIVHAGEAEVKATGTAFNVERLSGAVIVTLAEGHVDVANLASAKGPADAHIAMTVGEQLLVASTGANRRIVDPAGALAWRGGKVILEEEPLAIAAARINRYGTLPVRIDPRVAGVRISGAFKAGDQRSFADGVSTYFDLKEVRRPDGSIYLQLKE